MRYRGRHKKMPGCPRPGLPTAKNNNGTTVDAYFLLYGFRHFLFLQNSLLPYL
jgi:hypothetical protein